MRPDSVEARFLEYARTRDPRALAAVYDEVAVRLLAVATHLCSTVGEAEDAVQDTFLAALERPERWDSTKPLIPWLLGILGNRVKQARSRAAREPDIDRLTRLEPKDPADAIAHQELLRSIEQAVEHLAQPYRSVVLLRLRNGLSPADIAISLDRGPSTVRAQLARGLQMLRKMLPAGLTAAVVGTLSAGRGLAAVRQSVLDRAFDAHRALLAAQRLETLQTIRRIASIVGVAAVVTIGALLWNASDAGAATPTTIAAPLDWEITTQPVATDTTRLSLDFDVVVDESRSDVQTVGALEVTVRRLGVPVRNALVTLEPLRGDGAFLVHRRSTSWGDYAFAEPVIRVPDLDVRHLPSDTHGLCRFEGLRPGPYLLHAPDCFTTVQVVAGPVTSEVVDLPDATGLVTGIVLDARGAPVVGADVWLRNRRYGDGARVVACTDAIGRFEAVAAPYSTVGTRVPGYAPVAAYLGAIDGMTEEIELRAEVPGGAIHGRVVGVHGDPVPFAEVAVGRAQDTLRVFTRDPRTIAVPQRVRADADGHFVADGIAPGPVRVRARGPGRLSLERTVEVVPGRDAEVELTCEETVTIRGHVNGPDGTPATTARVQVGQHRFWGTATSTDQHGRFELNDVPAGEIFVTAEIVEQALCVATLRGEPGDVLEWNPALDIESMTVRGRATHEDGSPLAHGWVHRANGGFTAGDLVRTGANGEFTFRVPRQEARRIQSVSAFEADPRRGGSTLPRAIPLTIVHGVRVGDHDVVVRIPAARQTAGAIVGRVLDADGRAPGERVILEDLETRVRRRVQFTPLGNGGNFDTGAIPPGEYTITVRTAVPRQFGPFTVRSNESNDVGRLRFDRAAPTGDATHRRWLTMSCPDDGTLASGLFLEVRDDRRRIVSSRWFAAQSNDAWMLPLDLPAGSYSLEARTPTGLYADLALDIAADATPQRRPIVVELSRR